MVTAGRREPVPGVGHSWVPDGTVAALVVALGLIDAYSSGRYGGFPGRAATVVLLATALATGLSRRAPAAALGLVWATAAAQIVTGTPVLLAQLCVAAVAFGTARWGSTGTVWLSALSIPAGVALATRFATTGVLGVSDVLTDHRDLLFLVNRLVGGRQVGAALLGMSLLAVPWLAGLVLRVTDRARSQSAAAAAEIARAGHERAQAREIAAMRAEQARLARDVHDVVGHSLAVILAQAESGQYVPDDDPAALKTTLATIAASARTSLREVRQVLSATKEADSTGTQDLDALIEGLGTSGREVVSSQTGRPVPLPPELDLTAFRVLQEMLTNAIRHSRHGSAIIVRRQWPDSDADGMLTIEVRNATDEDRTQSLTGHGLVGMRQRLESVGGRLAVGTRAGVFAAIAWVPVRRS